MRQTERRSATKMGVPVTAGPEAVAKPAQHELTVLAAVAHELRGPLTALATSSELLAEDFVHLEAEQIKDMLGAMHRRALWLQGLVENLLCAATIREGRLALYRQSLSLADLLRDVDAVVRPILAKRGQSLRVRMAAGLPEVLGDSRRLGQVLINLILNASKFGAPDTSIAVTLSVRGDTIRVAVSDRGPGISAQPAELLFEPYYQAPASAGGHKDGIGLGLSIVKSIVEAHAGCVGVDRRPGGGARFWFVLPLTASHSSGKSQLAFGS